jgi:hypothetical protein
MTRDEINQANADTINRLAATEIMGWKSGRSNINGGALWLNGGKSASQLQSQWNPSTDANDAATCLRKIEERGLEEKFVDEIPDVVGTARVYDLCGDDIWLIAKATPEQTTRACLLAVCGE